MSSYVGMYYKGERSTNETKTDPDHRLIWICGKTFYYNLNIKIIPILIKKKKNPLGNLVPLLVSNKGHGGELLKQFWQFLYGVEEIILPKNELF